jgi:tetratricopeptide (TPR) repeat protein
MHISYIAFNRVVEEQAARDAAYRRSLKRNGKVLLSDARKLSDEELVAKLHSFDVMLDRQSLARHSEEFASAEELSLHLLGDRDAGQDRKEIESDWVWLCLVVLWERWLPDQPSLEMLDDRVQEGYHARGQGDSDCACRIWLEAWRWVLRIMETRQIQSIDEFDERFGGTQCVFNWVQNLESGLGESGLYDAQFLRERIEVCEECIRCLRPTDTLTIGNMRCALAESYFELGEREKADELFQEWLASDPQWGAGWIRWADCYQSASCGSPDPEKAAAILKKGLSIHGIRERDWLIERLGQLHVSPERTEGSRVVHDLELMADGAVLRLKKTVSFGGVGLPLSELGSLKDSLQADTPAPRVHPSKARRNEPCPCGSGKKHKKCCGR